MCPSSSPPVIHPHPKLTEMMMVIIFLCVIIVLFMAKSRVKKTNNKPKMPPEAAGAWPFIGHLHLLRKEQLLHKTFSVMADKYGPIFSVRLGINRALVISNWVLAKECFTINDKVFSSRPMNLAIKLLLYGHASMGFAPYGPYWRYVRKLAIVELLSSRRIKLLEHVRDTETKFFIRDLYKKCADKAVVVEMMENFGDLAMNNIVRVIAGKRYFGSTDNGEESRRCQKALRDLFHFIGLFLVSDALPWLGWLDYLRGYMSEMKRTAKELDSILGSWVKEHRQRRLMINTVGMNTEEEKQQDFINVLLSVMDNDGEFSVSEADTAIKAICLSLILGGNDTIVATFTWALSLLLNKPRVLKKAQDELDIQVGKHRQVEELDIQNLTYLQAIVKETLRLYPAAPLSGPREAMEDCTVAGFHVPTGTQLLVNLSKMHRDPSIWSKPLEFIPERFLEEQANLDVRGNDFEYLPFGSGRRICPGISFGLHTIHLTLARLLHCFELGTISDTLVDMSEHPGISVPRATPLEVVISPRLPAILYGD